MKTRAVRLLFLSLLFLGSLLLGGCFNGSVAALTPQSLPSEQLASAYALYQAGDTRQAEVLYRQITQNHPELALAWFYLGNLTFRRGALDEAQQHYIEAAQRDPHHAETQYNLGMLNLRNAEKRLNTALLLTKPSHKQTLIRHQLDWLSDFPL